MKVNVISQEVYYTISYDELCKAFKIPSNRHIDFVDLKLDPTKELIILDQIEPIDVARPKGDNEK